VGLEAPRLLTMAELTEESSAERLSPPDTTCRSLRRAASAGGPVGSTHAVAAAVVLPQCCQAWCVASTSSIASKCRTTSRVRQPSGEATAGPPSSSGPAPAPAPAAPPAMSRRRWPRRRLVAAPLSTAWLASGG
jgi:hypothetical protein